MRSRSVWSFSGLLVMLVCGFFLWFRAPQVVTVAVSTPPASTQPEKIDEEVIARGIEVYKSLYCGACHTLTAAGVQSMFGPSHDGLALTAQAHLESPHYRGEATTVAEYIRESIVQPEAFVAPEYVASRYRMPAFTEIPDDDLEALVMMLSLQQ